MCNDTVNINLVITTNQYWLIIILWSMCVGLSLYWRTLLNHTNKYKLMTLHGYYNKFKLRHVRDEVYQNN